MFLSIFIIVHISIAVNCEACAEFSIGSSNYKATFEIVTHFSEFKTWNELKGLCDDGYNLTSINTEEENNAILDILQENCANGVYAIGLSRESGSDRTMASSWNWESGETVEYLYWGDGEPNVGDTDCAFGFMTITDGRWSDFLPSDKLGNVQGSNGYGYICEKTVLTTTPVLTTEETTMNYTINKLTSLYNFTNINGTSKTITDSTSLVNESNSTFATTSQISSTGLRTSVSSGTTNGLTSLLSTQSGTISDAVTSNAPTESTINYLTTTANKPSTVNSGTTKQLTSSLPTHSLITSDKPTESTSSVNTKHSTLTTANKPSTVNSGTTKQLTSSIPTQSVVTSDKPTESTSSVNTKHSTLTTSKVQSTAVKTSTHSDITTNGLTTVPKISIRKDITSNTITISEKEEPGESRPTGLIEIVLPSASAFLIIVILIFILYRFHGRLICRKETKVNSDYEMSTSITSQLWKGSSPNGSDTDSSKGSIKDNDIPEQKSINTKHVSENNSSRLSSSLSEANPTYESVGPGDKIRLLSGPTSDDCNEGEVENPVYDSYTVESDYAVVDQPCNISSNVTTFGKPIGSGESEINDVTKTNTSMKNTIDFVEESSGTDKDDKMCTGSSPPNIDDSEKVQNVEELYAKPDMSKKSKSQIKHSDNTSKNDTITPLSSPTEVIMSTLASEGNDGQELVTNSNTDDVNEVIRNPDYEVVDLDDVLCHKASGVAASNDVTTDPVDEPEQNVIKHNEYDTIDIEDNTLLSTYENSPTETTDDFQADLSLVKPIEQSDAFKIEDIYSKPDMSKKRNRQNKSDEQ